MEIVNFDYEYFYSQYRNKITNKLQLASFSTLFFNTAANKADKYALQHLYSQHS